MKEIITISAINLKGGASKTSTIINLGGVMHESGRKPLLIDMDPQQSASQWAKQGGLAFPFQVIPLKVGNIKQFKERLNHLIKEHKVDTILFDTPPQIEEEALVSALLSDIVLIPITPSPLDIWAGERAIHTIREAQQQRKGPPKVALVPSRIISNTVLGREIKASLKQFNEQISPGISLRVSIAEAAIAGLPINLYAPKSQAHKEFKDLMKFVYNQIKK